MRVPRQDTARTRRNLLAAASDVFAEKGFRDATIAEISLRAGTNTASVNYHFGDKETLYREAWRHSFRESIEAHPPDGGVSPEAEPRQRLRGYVTAMLESITDKRNKEISHRPQELANPTGLLEEVTREEIRPLHARIERFVRDVIGPAPSEREVRYRAIGILSQCFIPVVITRMRKTENPATEDDPWNIDDLEAYAEHVVAFSLAGVRAVGRETKDEG
jgi:AcrR family transcriptional regulator